MIHVLRANPKAKFEYGPFQIRRMRPGEIAPERHDTAFGPLSIIDHANLEVGTLVKMHQHRNDEILSYLWRGSMVHEDSGGNRTSLSPKKLMMMNAGESFWHEESTPLVATEMLQIFIRPQQADLPGVVQFLERPGGISHGEWTLLAAPEGETAPLSIRQQVKVYDIQLEADSSISVPRQSGMAQWLYLMDGKVTLGEHQLNKGDAIAAIDEDLPAVTAKQTSTLVCFLVDIAVSGIMDGTISGQ